MPKQPLYPSTKGKASLRKVSIKRLRDQLDYADFRKLMADGEDLWRRTVELAQDLDKVQAKTTDLTTRRRLAEILQEVKAVESFTFNLTEP